jgi:hypothetical protein
MVNPNKAQVVIPAVIETFCDGSRLLSVLIDGRQFDLAIPEHDNGMNPAETKTFKGLPE